MYAVVMVMNRLRLTASIIICCGKNSAFFCGKVSHWRIDASTVWEVFEKLFSKEVYIVRGFCVSSLEALLEQLNFYSGK